MGTHWGGGKTGHFPTPLEKILWTCSSINIPIILSHYRDKLFVEITLLYFNNLDLLAHCEYYPAIFQILNIFISLPPTTSRIKRSFSTLRRVKTWLRSTTEDLLNGFLWWAFVVKELTQIILSFRMLLICLEKKKKFAVLIYWYRIIYLIILFNFYFFIYLLKLLYFYLFIRMAIIINTLYKHK